MTDSFNPWTVPAWQPRWLDDDSQSWAVVFGPEEERRTAYGDDPRAILAGECMRFGLCPVPDLAERLKELYADLLRAGMPIEHRWQVFLFLEDKVRRGVIDAFAYFPFVFEDPDRRIVMPATCGYASDGFLLDGDPMSRPKNILNVLEHGVVKNAGAIFGALLTLGDPRLLKLLWPLKHTLSNEDLHQASKTPSGYLHAGTIHFILDWMEGLDGDGQDLAFGTLVTSLIVRRRTMQVPGVATGLRPFPFDSVSAKEAEAMLKYIPIEEFTASVAPRMIALAETEPEPRLMPAVLKVWGLGREDLWNEWSDKIDVN
jgi:hypothetical protein